MVVLGISASNVTGQCAASAALRWPDGRLEVARTAAGQRADVAWLAQQACARHGVAPQDLRELRLDLGPGSYVGLRTAVTFARVLLHWGPLPVATVDSLALMVAGARHLGAAGQRLVPVLDARRQRLHVAADRLVAGRIRCEVPPQAIAPTALAGLLRPGDLVLAAPALHPGLAAVVAQAGARLDTPVPVDAADLFAPELVFAPAGVAHLEPLYLMGSYAE